jgi:bifunctional UDP-N-acetylglucosamine pyrophosphorylase/glucosamine-1-phosphate N-acetyltransferase
MQISAIILAAGQGTRMRSKTPKVLHLLAGRAMIDYSVLAVAGICTDLPVVVVGHGAEVVKEHVGNAARFVIQEPQLGTAHAVQQAENLLSGKSDLILIFYGDMPLLRHETLKKLVEVQKSNTGALSLITVIADDPKGFGRVTRAADGSVNAIVEEASASKEQLAIRELNAGIYCCRSNWLWEALKTIKKSPKGEFYLTDLVEIAVMDGQTVNAIPAADPEEAIGINTRIHLAEAESILRRRINEKWMLAGVTMIKPSSVFIDDQVQLGEDTVLWPNTYLRGLTVIGSECTLGPDVIMEDTIIGNGCRIQMAVLEGAVLEDHVSMGPYAHLRKGAHLASGVHMGNFGEVKNSYLGPETKMGHFSYIGDATIGTDVNIGAGTITCNFDGVKKNKTVIEDGAFIGSDTMLVAPVKIGKKAKTGAGAVVNRDVPPGSVVVGVPAREIQKRVTKEKADD